MIEKFLHKFKNKYLNELSPVEGCFVRIIGSILLFVVGIFALNIISIPLGKRVLKKHPDYIHFFKSEGSIELQRNNPIFATKDIFMTLNGSDTLGEVYRTTELYNLSVYNFRFYSWIWMKSIELTDDTTFVAKKRENTRVAPNQQINGRLDEGARGKVYYINEKKSWALVSVDFFSKTDKLKLDPPRRRHYTFSHKSDGKLPRRPRKDQFKFVYAYVKYKGLIGEEKP